MNQIKRILITGASRGIGRSIALELAGQNIHLLLHGRDQAALEEVSKLVEKKGATVEVLTAELADSTKVIALAGKVADESLDILINNAAIATVAPAVDIDLEDWNRTLAVNVTAPFLLTKHLIPIMPKGSSIVNILSIASQQGFGEWSAYCMSKFALDGFAKSVREELRPRGIRVINIYPGSVDTDIWNDVPGEHDHSQMMSPDDVARTVAMSLGQPAGVSIDDVTITNLGGTT